jgi:hypothetical protein
LKNDIAKLLDSNTYARDVKDIRYGFEMLQQDGFILDEITQKILNGLNELQNDASYSQIDEDIILSASSILTRSIQEHITSKSFRRRSNMNILLNLILHENISKVKKLELFETILNEVTDSNVVDNIHIIQKTHYMLFSRQIKNIFPQNENGFFIMQISENIRINEVERIICSVYESDLIHQIQYVYL